MQGEPIFLKCSNKLLDEPGTQPNWVWDEANVRAALLKSSAKLYILIKKPQTEPEPSLSSDDDGLPELRSLRSRPGRSTEASPMRSPRSVSPPLPTFNLNGPSQDSYEDAAVYTNFMGTYSEEDALAIALRQSQQASGTSQRDPPPEAEVRGILSAHAEQVIRGASRELIVSRRNVWGSTYMSFLNRHSLSRKTGDLKVEFWSCVERMTGDDEDNKYEQLNGELGIDYGALRREYFRLLVPAIINDSGLLRGNSIYDMNKA